MDRRERRPGPTRGRGRERSHNTKRDTPGGYRPMADPRTVAAATSILLTLGLVCFAEPGFAQQPDSSASAEALKKLSIEQLMNLEVTSVSRRPERLAQAASAIQVITQADIRRSGASSLPEALRLATNLQVAQVNSRDWAISARGFNSTTANKLLVLIDGRTVYTPLYSGVFWDVQEMPLADIDRIEVISGPGATLMTSIRSMSARGISCTSQNTPEYNGVYTVRPSMSTRSLLAVVLLNPRALMAQSRELTCATCKLVARRRASGRLEAPERRMSAWVMT